MNPPGLHARSATVSPNPSLAVIEFLTGALLRNPRRVGKPLQRQLAGLWSARRGTYRVLYEIDEVSPTARVLDVSHRGDVYRPR